MNTPAAPLINASGALDCRAPARGQLVDDQQPDLAFADRFTDVPPVHAFDDKLTRVVNPRGRPDLFDPEVALKDIGVALERMLVPRQSGARRDGVD